LKPKRSFSQVPSQKTKLKEAFAWEGQRACGTKLEFLFENGGVRNLQFEVAPSLVVWHILVVSKYIKSVVYDLRSHLIVSL
jgi:hypothetical protein